MSGPFLETVSHLPKALVAGVAGAVVLAGGAVAAIQLTGNDSSDQLADASKVLQSVDVGVGQDGRLTSVKGTTVGTTASGKQFSVDDSYAPGKVADQLPVRVLTSYRTAKGTGTDLSDLDGYTGRVDITLTVQNLTQKAKNLTFDVGGTQQSRSALVGVPLTVVGSTALPDTKPSDVVAQENGKSGGTNGVLSQNSDGKAQVQWATLLAPPQLGASTTMDLSVNAKDFEVPDFDLSVQPGLVTDPSIGGVLNEAFSPENSSQLALTRRTIDLIGKVNGVLGQAGKSMGTVRTTLKNSSDKLGAKTVGDLKGSTQTIASSVKGLQQSSTSLGQDLTSSLKGTQSATLQELQATNQAINALLGDTSAAPPRTVVNPGADACSIQVTQQGGNDSIYGNLQKIASLLDGYSDATGECSKQLRDRIVNTVGPDDPAECTDTAREGGNEADNNSASCSLFTAKEKIGELATNLDTQGKDAVEAFYKGIAGLYEAVNGTKNPDPAAEREAQKAYSELKCRTGDDGGPTNTNGLASFAYQLQICAGSIGGYAVDSANDDAPVPTVSTDRVLAAAKAAKESLAGLETYLNDTAQAGLDTTDTAIGTKNDLETQICTTAAKVLAQGGGNGAQLAQDVESLRKYTSNRGCLFNQLDGSEDTNLNAELAKQRQLWGQVSTTSKQFTDLSSAIDEVSNAAVDLDKQVAAFKKRFNAVQIKTEYDKLVYFKEALSEQIGKVVAATSTAIDDQDSSSSLQQIRAAFDKAQGLATDANDAIVDPVAVSQAGKQSADDVDKLFNASIGNLSKNAREIADKGQRTITQQKATFAVRQKQSGDRITASVSKGLQQVNTGVGSSVKDLGAAKGLLQGDINDVLLDLGTRDVKGSGLLGAMARSAATTGTANFQLAQAITTASSYANVRQGDVASILLGQAQAQAGQEAQAALPPFVIQLPDSARHTTVYSMHITP